MEKLPHDHGVNRNCYECVVFLHCDVILFLLLVSTVHLPQGFMFLSGACSKYKAYMCIIVLIDRIIIIELQA
jgi:hypothetical protein